MSNLEASRNYYGHVLGYEEFSLSPGRAEGSPETIYYKVNDRQYILISPGLKDETEDKLMHIGFETADAQQLRDYLAGRGVDVPAKVTEDLSGNRSFTVKDPNGVTVEFVQYLPDSIESRNSGNLMPATRLSDHILHVGVHVTDVPKADKFYKDILGFRLLWEGGPQTNPKSVGFALSDAEQAATGWNIGGGSQSEPEATGRHASRLPGGDGHPEALREGVIAWVYAAGQACCGARRPLAGEFLRSGWVALGADDSETGGEALLHGFARPIYLEVNGGYKQ